MSQVVLASPSLLFDRLLGAGDGAVIGPRLDSVALKMSLLREVGQLFSTKSRLTLGEFMGDEVTVLDYGLPDFSALSPISQSDMDLMTEVITKALRCFEPRLRQVGVTLTAEKSSARVAHAAILGAVSLSGQALRVNFDLAFSASGTLTLGLG